jgi:hypothetical protein
LSSKGRFVGVEWLLSSCNLFGAPLILPPECKLIPQNNPDTKGRGSMPLMQFTATKIWIRTGHTSYSTFYLETRNFRKSHI